jgi:hypothetical protein
MKTRIAAPGQPPESAGGMSCSFCWKSGDQVAQLISSPSGRPRAYICNECVDVCVRILIAEPGEPEEAPTAPLGRPHAAQLLEAVENWIREESAGAAGAEAYAAMRALAIRFATGSE